MRVLVVILGGAAALAAFGVLLVSDQCPDTGRCEANTAAWFIGWAMIVAAVVVAGGAALAYVRRRRDRQ